MRRPREVRGRPLSTPSLRGTTVSCDARRVRTHSRLQYNGITLPERWPPRAEGASDAPVDAPVDAPRAFAPHPPYLREPPAIVPIDVGRQLFVDDFLVERSSLTRVFHRPRVHPEPVLLPGPSWAASAGRYAAPFSGGVWYLPEEQRFAMWFRRTDPDGLALALSEDGVRWSAPSDLARGDDYVLRAPVNSSTVWRDEGRWLYFGAEGVRDDWRFVLRESLDGRRWSAPRATRAIWGDRSTVFYNPFRQVWGASLRVTDAAKRRARAYVEAATPEALMARIEFNEFSKIEGACVPWVAADELDPRHPDPRFAAVAPELYTLDVAPYESLMLGLFSIWQGPTNPEAGRLMLQKRNDLLLGFSRDGFHWDRPSRDRFIGCTWDEASWRFGNVQSAAGGPLVVGDSLYFYFSAHALPRGERWDTDASAGLAVLRRDGFASMNAGPEGGELLTRRLGWSGRALFVNVDCPTGALRVEALDEHGGLLARSAPLRVDATAARVEWAEGDLDGAQVIRLRFQLERGALYAFWSSPDERGHSGGFVGAGGPGLPGLRDRAATGNPGGPWTARSAGAGELGVLVEVVDELREGAAANIGQAADLAHDADGGGDVVAVSAEEERGAAALVAGFELGEGEAAVLGVAHAAALEREVEEDRAGAVGEGDAGDGDLPDGAGFARGVALPARPAALVADAAGVVAEATVAEGVEVAGAGGQEGRADPAGGGELV